MKAVLQSSLFRGMIAATAAVLLSIPACGQSKAPGYGKTTVTILNRHKGAPPPTVTRKDLYVRVDGHPVTITRWQAATGPVQVVLLIDNGARTSLGQQIGDIRKLIQELPSNDSIGIAYMQNGMAEFTGPLTSNKQVALRELQLPAGTPGSSASPYFCLSYLAKHWPSHVMNARREVIMVTNGVDNYEPR